jgi:hypothetical protein
VETGSITELFGEFRTGVVAVSTNCMVEGDIVIRDVISGCFCRKDSAGTYTLRHKPIVLRDEWGSRQSYLHGHRRCMVLISHMICNLRKPIRKNN